MFADISAEELAEAFRMHPQVVKPVLVACSVAARAVERDLDIKNLNTYQPNLSDSQADQLAGYLKSFLPPVLEIPALCHADRLEFIDKEIRKRKGQWEKRIVDAINSFSPATFRKRKFSHGGETFELDAASLAKGAIEIGIDVKRIEARRDIHKRADEIANKGAHLRAVYPDAKFAAVIYYPFPQEHANVQNRLQSPNIDAVAFASDSDESIETAARLVLAKLGALR